MGQGGLELIEEGIRLLAAEDPHTLPDVVLLASTETLLSVEDRIDGILARRMQAMHTRDTTVHQCGRQLRAWLVEDQHRSEVDAARRTSLARALPCRPVVDEALAAGEISLDHATRIVSLVRASSPDLQQVIEKELVDAARYVDPTRLGVFCRELRSRLGAGETAAERDARQYDHRWLRLTATFDGMHRLDGMLDPTSAATLTTALHALTTTTPASRSAAGSGGDEVRSVGQRRADALVAIAEFALSHVDTPDIGGERAHLMVLAPLNTLREELDHTDTTGSLNGQPVSAATIRMLACDAGIIPAILASPSEVLDLGRKTPTWTLPQRRALKIESGGHCR
jgi:hypothetical protein